MSINPVPPAPRSASIFGRAAVRKLSHYLYGFFRRRYRSKEDIEDLSQEVWLRLARHDYSETEIQEPCALLHCIAERVLIDQHRKEENSLRIVESAEEDLDVPSELLSARLEDGLSIRQQFERLDEVWLGLSQTHYRVWTLHKVNGMPQKEVARALDLSVHTVKKYVTEATRHIREAMLRDSQ